MQTEDSVILACVRMVVKLSEGAFRPVFIKVCLSANCLPALPFTNFISLMSSLFQLHGWATRESEKSDRLITFYRLCNG